MHSRVTRNGIHKRTKQQQNNKVEEIEIEVSKKNQLTRGKL